jgi:hypothetical protein
MAPVSTHSVSDISFEQRSTPQAVTLGWTLRRAALGLLILLGAVALGAWLMHASIEPDGANAGPASQSEYAVPPK